MPKQKNYKSNLHLLLKFFLIILVLGAIIYGIYLLLPLRNSNPLTNNYATPIFTSVKDELQQVSNQSFTQELFNQATTLQPLLKQPGTQVHLGFWSGPGNHGNLVKLLDTINNYTSPDKTVNKAIWDEGSASSLQYPAYVTINKQGWYERAYPTNGKVTLYGMQYSDPNPVTPQQADEVWGAYSQRYADTAKLFAQATGKPVEVWCFVQGAKKNRIFYMYELPELQKLEKEGYVTVHFAKNEDANWQNPNDWITGTANAPIPTQ